MMTRLRDLDPFPALWSRRTTITDEAGESFDLLSVEDLVEAKKTQRMKDWPVIEALVEGHHKANSENPTPAQVGFWLRESRARERVCDLCARFPEEARALTAARPLLALGSPAISKRSGRNWTRKFGRSRRKTARYWAPLKRELDEFRRIEREGR